MNPSEEIVLDLKALSERTRLRVRWLRDYIKPDAPFMIPHFKVKGKNPVQIFGVSNLVG